MTFAELEGMQIPSMRKILQAFHALKKSQVQVAICGPDGSPTGNGRPFFGSGVSCRFYVYIYISIFLFFLGVSRNFKFEKERKKGRRTRQDHFILFCWEGTWVEIFVFHSFFTKAHSFSNEKTAHTNTHPSGLKTSLQLNQVHFGWKNAGNTSQSRC